MSLAQPTAPDRKPGPSLTLDLSNNNNNNSSAAQSNNPFRNPRTASPAIPSPCLATPRSAPINPERPVSRNPFLASFEQDLGNLARKSPLQEMMDGKDKEQVKLQVTDDSDVKELFDKLTLKDTAPAGAPLTKIQSRPEQGPTHRPSRSEEERRRMHSGRPPPRRKNPTDELDIFASPEKSGERKLRRNSESSLMDRPPMTEEERRRREKHRREREARHRDSKRDGSRSRHPRKKPHGLDLIDKLDVTGIYGPGLFHHDGPFDACNPHRNRKKDHRAPMQAFPDGSANMNLGGAGPLHSTLDLNKIHGTGTEGYKDFGTGYDASGRRPDASRGLSFDPYARTEPVHGEETFGLGTSTFLEGAPASRKAIERRESELEAQQRAELAAGGIGRKKSIAQRIRGMSTGRPRPLHAAGSIRSPEGRYADRVNGAGATSPEQASPPTLKPLPDQSQSAGGPSRAPVTLTDEKNPFESIYDEAYDKKMAEIKAAKEEKKEAVTGRARALSSPKKGVGFPLERRATTDTNEEGAPAAGMASGTETAPEAKSIGGGFLDRVKSLKGGRKPIRHPS